MLGKKRKPKMKTEPGHVAEKLPKRSFISRFDLLNRFRHWFLGGISLTRSLFRVAAAWQGVLIICTILAILFILSAYYTGAGEFVISLDSEMSRDGFYLSNTNNFDERMICINGVAVASADNISIYDIARDVKDVDGMHNGTNYVAQTFYLTNETGETKDYHYTLNIRQSAKNADKAMWIMVYYNGKQTVYAMEGTDGEPEVQYSIFPFPFEEDAENPELYTKITGDLSELSGTGLADAGGINSAYKLTTKPFLSQTVVCNGIREEIANGEVDKYTVVIWYEGEDPECVDDILGGWVELYMTFSYQ
ncbi:MAG: hypothetical protein IJA10_00715 [Lachnospiraceae bacterium]|nr:hypothetical protein [Lachnospiraceae bacterium]